MQEIDISDTILQYWRNTTKFKKTPSGWYSGNAVCCHHRGETKDKRGRGGVILDNEGGLTYHCFNCNFSTKFALGHPFSQKMQDLLSWMGMDNSLIRKLSLESFKHRSIGDFKKESAIQFKKVSFQEQNLPPEAIKLTPNDKKFVDFIESRGLTINDAEWYITPSCKWRNKNRIIIPYKYKDKIVGWTSRYLDNKKPKYLNEHQSPAYIYGIDYQKKSWDYIILCEGILDAISIKGMALMHSDISPAQMNTLRSLKKQVIIVPDQDKAGINLINIAIKEGFMVSIPDWGVNSKGEFIHDINEALQEYGKTTTLLSIIQCAEQNKIKIKMALNDMKKKINMEK